MTKFKNAWLVRPYPHGKYRMKEFIENSMVAIGWPATGDLKSRNRDQIAEILRESYYADASNRVLGQVTGIIDRFVNQIKSEDGMIVPDGSLVYIGTVKSEYHFHSELRHDDEGYPHWIGVEWMFNRQPVSRSELPAILYDSLKGRQTVYAIPGDAVWPVMENPERFIAFDSANDYEYKAIYIDRLSKGVVPGINSRAFEDVVLKILSLYYPSLHRLPTTNSRVGADTDLIAELPGSVVVRIQVKCFQDDRGPLEEWVVKQLRDSMNCGENGIIVTTSCVSENARKSAEADLEKPIDFLDVSGFAQLVFDNIQNLTDKEIWNLGLRCIISGR